MAQWESMSRPYSLGGQQLLMEGCTTVHSLTLLTDDLAFRAAARGIDAVRSSAGDEILEVNGEPLHGLTHDEALHKFKVR